MKIQYLPLVMLLCLLIIPISVISETNLDQTSSFISEPADIELQENDNHTLTWSVSSSEDPTYKIYMTQDASTEQLIANGKVTDGSVDLELHKIPAGTFMFSCNVIDSTTSIWSNVTVTVNPLSSSPDDNSGSDNGFLIGFQYISLLGVVAIVMLRRTH